MGPVQLEITEQLNLALKPTHLRVVNESHLHEGHAHMGPETHFRVTMASHLFMNKKAIERHRLVHGVLAELLKAKIHALTLELYTPDEWSSKK
jgi:stress-induced morphogen